MGYNIRQNKCSGYRVKYLLNKFPETRPGWARSIKVQVISASRRTDIPTFYTPWLLNRLRAGSVTYPNPFSGQLYPVSLRAEDVHSLTFWSKNYGPLLPHLPELSRRGYRAYRPEGEVLFDEDELVRQPAC